MSQLSTADMDSSENRPGSRGPQTLLCVSDWQCWFANHVRHPEKSLQKLPDGGESETNGYQPRLRSRRETEFRRPVAAGRENQRHGKQGSR